MAKWPLNIEVDRFIQNARQKQNHLLNIWLTNCSDKSKAPVSQLVNAEVNSDNRKARGGGGVLGISRDEDDRMGAKIKTQKNP